MATVYSAPVGYEPPEFDIWATGYDEWRAQEQEYCDRLAALCKRNGNSPLLGRIIRFPVADGYAQYMVWSTKPLAFIHLELGDAYSVHPALIRGLRVADVKQMVEADDRLASIFGSSSL